MNFNKPSVENPEYKEISSRDVIDFATGELVDKILEGAGQDFIMRKRPHLIEDTRRKVEETYEASKDMFENFPGDASGDSADDRVIRRAKVLASLFAQSNSIDMSVGEENPLDKGFSEANSNKDAAALYVMDLAGTDDIEKIHDFDRQLKNAEALIDIFKATDPFSYSKFQEALIGSDLPAAVAEIKNFRNRQLGEDGEDGKEKVV